MQKLISELLRLYLVPGAIAADELEQHVQGYTRRPIGLASGEGLTRAIVIDFKKIADGDEAQHWTLLCTMANALQAELGLPAPAVSISGNDGFALWLSLETPVPVARARGFVALLHKAYMPGIEPGSDAAAAAVELPPCLHPVTGKWAAFINPGLGASFAQESGLEMAPPPAGQIALLEGLQSIGAAQFSHAENTLRQSQERSPRAGAPRHPSATAPDGLLLADATLEDIVRHLHAKNIEPTFRHLIGD